MPFVRDQKSTAGLALPLVMIFLSLLAVMAASTLQSGITEYQIAANDRFREAAFQRAQGILSHVSLDISRFPVSSSLGIIACNNTVQNSNCTPAPLALDEPSLIDISGGEKIFYEVERLSPLFQRGFTIRERQNSVSSSLAYDAALFEVRVSIDGSADNLGSASLAQGIAVLTPSTPGNSAE